MNHDQLPLPIAMRADELTEQDFDMLHQRALKIQAEQKKAPPHKIPMGKQKHLATFWLVLGGLTLLFVPLLLALLCSTLPPAVSRLEAAPAPHKPIQPVARREVAGTRRGKWCGSECQWIFDPSGSYIWNGSAVCRGTWSMKKGVLTVHERGSLETADGFPVEFTTWYATLTRNGKGKLIGKSGNNQIELHARECQARTNCECDCRDGETCRCVANSGR